MKKRNKDAEAPPVTNDERPDKRDDWNTLELTGSGGL